MPAGGLAGGEAIVPRAPGRAPASVPADALAKRTFRDVARWSLRAAVRRERGV